MKNEKEEIIFEQPVTFLKHPKIFVSKFRTGDTTPSILDTDMWVSPSSATTVTNFDDGAPGQTIQILGTGTLTVSNNANIKTNTGSNKVLAANKVYKFTLFENPTGTFVWYEGE